MPLWNPVSSGSYAAGALWTPDLTLTLMGRDFAQFMSPWAWVLPTAAIGQGGEEKVTDIGVCFPDSWDADLAFPVMMRLSLDFTLTVGGVEDPGNAWTESLQFWLKKGSDEGVRTTLSVSGIGTAVKTSTPIVTIDYGAGLVPTGPQVYEFWSNYVGASNVTVARAMADGATSWYGFVIP